MSYIDDYKKELKKQALNKSNFSYEFYEELHLGANGAITPFEIAKFYSDCLNNNQNTCFPTHEELISSSKEQNLLIIYDRKTSQIIGMSFLKKSAVLGGILFSNIAYQNQVVLQDLINVSKLALLSRPFLLYFAIPSHESISSLPLSVQGIITHFDDSKIIATPQLILSSNKISCNDLLNFNAIINGAKSYGSGSEKIFMFDRTYSPANLEFKTFPRFKEAYPRTILEIANYFAANAKSLRERF